MSSYSLVGHRRQVVRWIDLNDTMSVLDVGNCLGEGLLWDAQRSVIWWVDIQAGQILCCGLASEACCDVWQLSTRPTALAPLEDGRILVGAERSILVFDPETAELAPVMHFEDLPAGIRMNDGGVDCRGVFWLGSMNEGESEEMGQVYRIDHAGAYETCIAGIGISNGIVGTEDGRGLYVADSKAGKIYIWDVDATSGRPVRSRVFCDGTKVSGVPDGATLDADGCLWSARWDGWCVVRYGPDGEVNQTIELPVQQPTNCKFGGPSYQTLLVSSAREGLDEAALRKQPYAGGLFAVKTPFTGNAPRPFLLNAKGGST